MDIQVFMILNAVLNGAMFAIWSKDGWLNMIVKIVFLANMVGHILYVTGRL